MDRAAPFLPSSSPLSPRGAEETRERRKGERRTGEEEEESIDNRKSRAMMDGLGRRKRDAAGAKGGVDFLLGCTVHQNVLLQGVPFRGGNPRFNSLLKMLSTARQSVTLLRLRRSGDDTKREG